MSDKADAAAFLPLKSCFAMKLPAEKEQILHKIVHDLKEIEKVVAIVLGGSYATGNATEKSDLDIGIYYQNSLPFEVARIRSIAQKYAIEPPTVTDFYEWGPWVNGGAWVQTASGKVDLLYKNIDQIKTTIEKAQEGLWENHFEQQPPFGFSSMVFLAETKVCICLYDRSGVIETLKTAVQVYPEKLKAAIVQQCLWAAEFTLLHAIPFARNGDIYSTVGCLSRAIKNIVEALFALNEWYPITDKKAIDVLEKLHKRPENLRAKIEQVLCVNMASCNQNVEHLNSLFQEVVALADGLYQPFYRFKKG